MITIDELWAEDSKVACKSDETVFGSNTASLQSGDSLPVVLRVHLWQSLIVKDNRRHVVFPGYLKRSDAGFVLTTTLTRPFVMYFPSTASRIDSRLEPRPETRTPIGTKTISRFLSGSF